MNKARALHSYAVVGAMLLLPLINFFNAGAYTRAECIAGASLTWKDEHVARAKVLNKIPNARRHLQAFPIAGLMVQVESEIYVIFKEDCQNRRQILRNVLQLLSVQISDFPSFDVMEKNIAPSTDTIQVFGAYWIDG